MIARSPIAFHGAANDRRVHLLEKSSASVHVLTRAGTQAKVVQAHSSLHKAFASQRRIAGFDADRGSSANAKSPSPAARNAASIFPRVEALGSVRPISKSRMLSVRGTT